jgi:hypothetical protein
VVAESDRPGGSSAGVRGLVEMKWMRESVLSDSNSFFCVDWEALREVQIWPWAGTYWRGSWDCELRFHVILRKRVVVEDNLTSLTRQIRQSLGGEERGTSYCVPQTSQIARSPDSNFMMVFSGPSLNVQLQIELNTVNRGVTLVFMYM